MLASASALRSAPAQKAPPAPVSTATSRVRVCVEALERVVERLSRRDGRRRCGARAARSSRRSRGLRRGRKRSSFRHGVHGRSIAMTRRLSDAGAISGAPPSLLDPPRRVGQGRRRFPIRAALPMPKAPRMRRRPKRPRRHPGQLRPSSAPDRRGGDHGRDLCVRSARHARGDASAHRLERRRLGVPRHDRPDDGRTRSREARVQSRPEDENQWVLVVLGDRRGPRRHRGDRVGAGPGQGS